MSAAELEMLKALGNKLVPYVGSKPKSASNLSGPKKKATMNPAQLAKLRKLEELQKKQYLAGQYSFQRVLDLVCAVHGVTEAEVLSPRRHTKLVHARQAIIRIMRDKRGMKWMEIGRRLNRDHCTIIHGYRTAKGDYEEIAKRLEHY
jgi:chromosomal replication initiation ATPase DnaA